MATGNVGWVYAVCVLLRRDIFHIVSLRLSFVQLSRHTQSFITYLLYICCLLYLHAYHVHPHNLSIIPKDILTKSKQHLYNLFFSVLVPLLSNSRHPNNGRHTIYLTANQKFESQSFSFISTILSAIRSFFRSIGMCSILLNQTIQKIEGKKNT